MVLSNDFDQLFLLFSPMVSNRYVLVTLHCFFSFSFAHVKRRKSNKFTLDELNCIIPSLFFSSPVKEDRWIRSTRKPRVDYINLMSLRLQSRLSSFSRMNTINDSIYIRVNSFDKTNEFDLFACLCRMREISTNNSGI